MPEDDRQHDRPADDAFRGNGEAAPYEGRPVDGASSYMMPAPVYPWDINSPAPRPGSKKRLRQAALVCCVASVLIMAALVAPFVKSTYDGLNNASAAPMFLELSPADGTVCIDTVPDLSWTSASDADLCRVQISSDPDFENVIVDILTDSETYRPDAQLVNNATYYWHVAVCTDGIWGEWSPVSTFILSPPSISVTYSWTFYADGSEWTIDLNVSAEDYYEARDETRVSLYNIYEIARYVTPNDSAVMEIAEDLRSMAQSKGYDRYTTACFVLSFVQSITYDSDLNTTGYDEYPRYPVETIVDGTGDCEDTAALFASIIQSPYFRMDAVLVHLYSEGEPASHLAVGLYLSNSDLPNKVQFTYGDVTYEKSKRQLVSWEYRFNQYYYCEATNAIPIGWPTDLSGWHYTIIPC